MCFSSIAENKSSDEQVGIAAGIVAWPDLVTRLHRYCPAPLTTLRFIKTDIDLTTTTKFQKKVNNMPDGCI